jgi:hypothetical protein
VREGLVAAALVSFAFLPVAYSRVAVTDVGALLGVALALGFAVRARERGRPADFALAGVAAGVAVAFKYTAGLALVPLGIAALARARSELPRAAAGLALGAALAALAFVALNPYLLGSLDAWWSDLRDQAEVAADQPKPGQESSGPAYYLDSLTWGLGWAAAFAALAGALLELRRDWVRALMLAALPLALFAYLSVQSRYFGRWLLPAYPALALLAAAALTQLADALAARLPSPRAGRPRRARAAARAAPLAVITLLVLAQPLAADIRSARVLGRDDTRRQARDWLERRFPPELRVAVEPAVPGRWFRSNPEGTLPAWLSRCPRRPGWSEPGWAYEADGGERTCSQYKPGLVARPDGGVRASAYHLVLGPELIDDYRLYGYCLVMTVNVVRERALETGDPDARAYYERLARESELLREFSPYDPGEGPVPFSFDLSYNYYPPEYHRPGPTVQIRRLSDCQQASGPPLLRIPQAVEPVPFGERSGDGPPADEI